VTSKPTTDQDDPRHRYGILPQELPVSLPGVQMLSTLRRLEIFLSAGFASLVLTDSSSWSYKIAKVPKRSVQRREESRC
jgi:hypothetical protein